MDRRISIRAINPKQIRIWISVFVSDFGFRISTFSSGSSHSGNLRERENSARDFFPGKRFDLINRDGVSDLESPGLGSAKRFQMGAAAEGFADLVGISTNV